MSKFMKAIKNLEPPNGDARTLSFIMKNQDQDLLGHITIPPHVDTKELIPKDYQMKEIILGKPTMDTMKVLITIGLKKVFKYMDRDELDPIILQKKNDLLRGYLNEMVGPIDLDNPKVSLEDALEKKQGGPQMDSFLDSC